MIANLLRTLRIKRDISRRLKLRKAARAARAEAAQRGISTRWKRAGERTRLLFASQRT